MLQKTPFGSTRDGTPVDLFTLRHGTFSCDILTYGAALRALRVPDRSGGIRDVVLGFGSIQDYEAQDAYIGAIVGRMANRIGGASFSLGGVTFPLAANDGPHHLHGGLRGFDKQVWTPEAHSDDSLTLSLVSPDGDEGYPGELRASVTYTLDDDGLTIRYEAQSDQATFCNLTSHAYFNLAGHASGPVLDQEIHLFADAYTPTVPGSIPTGEIAPVDGTSMDLRQLTPIGARIDEDFPQLVHAGGYDHNWVLTGEGFRTAAIAQSRESGIRMEVRTTQPGVQFYTGNFLDGSFRGKDGAPYVRRCAFCLETQRFPDTPHHPNFPSVLLRAGDLYREETRFLFSTF